MAKPLSSWPLLLCGPMLRRVEPTGVSVFVALKHARAVTLTVFDGTTTVAQRTTSTTPFGRYLHAAVVTAVPTSGALAPDKIYTYDVKLTASGTADFLDTDRTDKTLVSSGLAGPGSLLAGSLALGYAPNARPGFALPPTVLKDLRLAHASCRKAHGRGRDALPILDTIIQESRTDPLKRPHQLFLTGDQIYADDVAEALLEQLSGIGRDLLSWTPEEPLLPREAGGAAPTEGAIAPGIRDSALRPPLTSDHAQCHLIRLGEFYAMYLFAWSDALWASVATRPLPDPATFSGEPEQYVAEENRIYLYNEQVLHLRSFFNSLGKVRRALANVPTYMIFDDHEVTDDWFLHRRQRSDILASPLGTRVVTNGLCAYSVFQGWGNQPVAFDAGTAGGLFLSALSQWTGQDDARYSTLRNSVGTTSSGAPPTLRFDYAVSGPAHEVIVLDTRTRRGYPSGADEKAHADLLPVAEIQAQVVNRIPSAPSVPKPLTVLVSAAPLLGHPLLEFGVWLVPGFLSTWADRETWLISRRRQAFERLLEALVPCRSVLILSGDVHHAFTVGVHYWDERTSAVQRASFVQMVASALKNQPRNVDKVLGGPPPIPRVFFGWAAPGKHVRERVTTVTGVIHPDVYVEGTPAVRSVQAGDQVVDPPQWRYRVGWVNDRRTFADRSERPALAPPSSTAWLERQRALALEHRHTARNDQMRTVVTRNNLGTLRFAATPIAAARPMIVTEQTLWYRLEDDSDDGRPYTSHWADLSPPAASDPKPDAPGSTAPPPTNAATWADLISFRPPASVQSALKLRGFYVHRLEDAWGQRINLDRYPVRVSVMPTLNGTQLDAKGLLDHFRLHLNDLVDLNLSEFSAYDPQDATKWSSTTPVGAVIEIEMKFGGRTLEKGSVVCAEFADDHWTFSTVWTHRDWSHPVSGNRQFGYVADAGTHVFFTRGADRTTQVQDEMGDSMIFGVADNLWCSLQDGLALFVNNHGGVAAVEQRIWHRYLWLGARATYHNPTVDWVP